MFTIYIHIFEVLASHSEGTTVRKIVEMGSEYTRAQISAKLRALEVEGYVRSDRGGKTIVYQMTDKAIEYFETVTRKYAAAHVMDDIADYVSSAEQASPREETVVDIMFEEQPERIHKVWTPRKTLIIQAAHLAKKHKINAHIAIEEVIQDWQQKRINLKAVEYYMGLAQQGQLRLITDVKNYRA